MHPSEASCRPKNPAARARGAAPAHPGPHSPPKKPVPGRARQASAVLDARLGEGEKREKDLAARLAAVEAQAKATAEQLAQAQAQAAGLQAAAARVEQMEHELAESRVQQRELLAMLTKPQQIKN